MADPAPALNYPLAAERLADCVVEATCVDGRRVLCLKNDYYIGRALLTYHDFSPGETALFTALVRPGMVVVDAGANIGVHTLTLSRLVEPGGLVVAYEPFRFLYHLLCGNLARNGCLNVRAYPYAVGAEEGTLKLPVLEWRAWDNFGGTALKQHPHGRIPVECVRLDDMLPRLDFLKADVEGMEWDVCLGARRLIAEHHPILYLENNPGPSQLQLIADVQALGYDVYWHTPRLIDTDPNVYGATRSLNVLALPPGTPAPTVGDLELIVHNAGPSVETGCGSPTTAPVS